MVDRRLPGTRPRTATRDHRVDRGARLAGASRRRRRVRCADPRDRTRRTGASVRRDRRPADRCGRGDDRSPRPRRRATDATPRSGCGRCPVWWSKDGADGVMAAAFPDGRAFALKVAGGSDEARRAATAEAMRVLGVDVDGAHRRGPRRRRGRSCEGTATRWAASTRCRGCHGVPDARPVDVHLRCGEPGAPRSCNV